MWVTPSVPVWERKPGQVFIIEGKVKSRRERRSDSNKQ